MEYYVSEKCIYDMLQEEGVFMYLVSSGFLAIFSKIKIGLSFEANHSMIRLKME